VLPAAKFNSWIVWERPTPVAGEGADVAALDWQRVAGCWAQMQNAGGLEVQMADQMESRRWWNITIRKSAVWNGATGDVAIDATCRGLYKNARVLNVTAIADDDESNEALHVTAWEGLGIQ
jgi:head-tail adaptor